MNKLDVSEQEFDAFYGKGVYALARGIINELGPTTRRDDWWATDGPYIIIATHLMRSRGDE